MEKTNTKLLGLFVVGGIFLLVVGVLVFGSGQFFKQTWSRVAYFTEPLDGLSEGAPVRFRGVKIGTVTKIVLDFNLKDLKMTTPVYLQIDPDRFVVSGGDLESGTEKKRVGALIKKGLRAQVSLDSLVTGQKVVDLVMRPKTKATLVGDQSRVKEIPTIPSETAEIKSTFTKLLDHLGKLNIAQINKGIMTVLTGAGKLVDNPEIPEIIHNVNLAVPDARRLVNNVNGEVDPLANSFRGAADKATGTLRKADGAVNEVRKTFVAAQGTEQKANRLLDSANSLIKPGARAHFELIEMMQEVTAAARAVRGLANTLQRDPESMLFGKTRSGGRK